ncbi:MAG: o-succinylbenzoate synthase [Ignavibacteriaceae bacterium]
MNHLTLKYHPYSLDLKTPFETSRSKISEREGFIIILSDGVAVGAGEAAPLPDFGSETYESEVEFLKDFKLKLKLDLSNFQDSLEENLASFEKLPALRHGFEQALLNFMGAKSNISLNELLNQESSRTIKVNATIGFLSPEDIKNRTSQLLKEGYRTFKIKVGRENFSDDLEAVKIVREIIPAEGKIRTDANGKWELNSAIENLKQLEQFDIEYCEQPVSSISDFIKLKGQTKIPLAADESVRNYKDAEEIIDKKAADVLILKPMMLGGITRTVKIIDLAKKNNVKVIITSSIETAVGRSFAVLASSFLKDDNAHGLATGAFFEKDFVDDLYPVKNGIISLG